MILDLDNKELFYSEEFYSIQGEGPTTGVPSIFLRFPGCNLMCGGSGTEHDKKLHNGATWRCDTIEVWREKIATTIGDKLIEWEGKRWHTLLEDGAHLIFTGGEPSLHEEKILDFMTAFGKRFGFAPFMEIETNGTKYPETLVEFLSQINISPKLSNSGMPKEKRINKDAITKFLNLPESIFKFVIASESDWEEAVADYIEPFNIPNDKVWIMPAAGDKGTLMDRMQPIAELAIKNNIRFSNRLHVDLWNQLTGC